MIQLTKLLLYTPVFQLLFGAGCAKKVTRLNLLPQVAQRENKCKDNTGIEDFFMSSGYVN